MRDDGQSSPPESGWWKASDGRWYPPEARARGEPIGGHAPEEPMGSTFRNPGGVLGRPVPVRFWRSLVAGVGVLLAMGIVAAGARVGLQQETEELEAELGTAADARGEQQQGADEVEEELATVRKDLDAAEQDLVDAEEGSTRRANSPCRRPRRP